MTPAAELIDLWKTLLRGVEHAWVLFAHGTCVVLSEPEGEPEDQARGLLQAFGGAPRAGQTGCTKVYRAVGAEGWLVCARHRDVCSFVGAEAPGEERTRTAIRLAGEAICARDARAPRVLHVEPAPGLSATSSRAPSRRRRG